MYRPCLHCEGKKYDKDYCPTICTYGEARKQLEASEHRHDDLIVQYAVLWGEKLGLMFSGSKEFLVADKMLKYNSDELLILFTGWVTEYLNSEEDDSKSFFEQKLTELLTA